MNRPPKKKNDKKELLADPRFDAEELEKAGSETSKPKAGDGDDRNLIEIDEALKEAEFEDKVWLMWNENKSAIVGGAIFALIAVIGVQAYKMFQAQAIVSMQDAYSEAQDPESKLIFAGDYDDKALGGIAVLEVADTKFEEKAYTEAASLYQQAYGILSETKLAGRILIGQAIATIRGGDVNGGQSMLSQVVENSSLLQAAQAEAAYHLAVLAVEQGKTDEAKTWLERIGNLDHAGSWVQLADQLKSSHASLQSS